MLSFQISSTRPHVEPDVDHLFQLGVNVMYHEDMYLWYKTSLKTYGSAGQFCPPNFFLSPRNVQLPCVGKFCKCNMLAWVKFVI
jgi:hypothetical protein